MWFASWLRVVTAALGSTRTRQTKRRHRPVALRLLLDQLEDRYCPSTGTIDPAVLATFGDAYTGTSAVAPATASGTTSALALASASTAATPATTDASPIQVVASPAPPPLSRTF